MCASQSFGHRKIQIIALVHPTDVECFQAEFDTLIKPLLTCVLLVYLTSCLACVLLRNRWQARYLSFVIKVSQTTIQFRLDDMPRGSSEGYHFSYSLVF